MPVEPAASTSASTPNLTSQGNVTRQPTLKADPPRTANSLPAPIPLIFSPFTPPGLKNPAPTFPALTSPVYAPWFGTDLTLQPYFEHILLQNKRKNRYAPAMVSMLNPLRQRIPTCAWDSLPFCERGRRPPVELYLPSERFRNALYDRTARSREECSRYNFKHRHCHHCLREPFRVSLFMHNLRRLSQAQADSARGRQPTSQITNSEDNESSASEPINPLDSPQLRDEDEFRMDVDDDEIDLYVMLQDLSSIDMCNLI
ncbi:hypothetical protein H0H92_005665 [Tricholoma furcatifolium]|nr:hypothetical protein H0H92_005665 [Tricholoma furcatifolium]